jgi:copper transport protein
VAARVWTRGRFSGRATARSRSISADAHPVAGAFSFDVKSASTGGECAQVFGKGTPGSVDALFKFMRALDFALILLVVGGAVALALVLRSAAFELRARLYRTLAGLSVGLLVAGILCIVLQGAVAGGFGLQEAFRWATVDSVLQTRFGKAFLWQLALAVVIAPAALLASRSRNASVGWLVLAPALLLLPTLSAAGHARTSGTIALIADVVHILAASIWVGGLGFTILALLLAGADRWPLAARVVPVFSILAVGSVVTLIAAGSLRGYQEVRAFHGLWDTTYGQLLLVKIGLVLPLLALGAYNNRFAVPRLKRQIASAIEQRRFVRAAGAELAIMAAIVGVTAVLVTEPPAKASVKAPKLISDTVPIGNLEVNYTIDPAKAGSNEIHLYFFTPKGEPANVDDAKLSATLQSKGLGPVRIPLQRIVPSHYTTPAGVFPQPGEWQVTLEARRGEFEALTQTVTVPIREG